MGAKNHRRTCPFPPRTLNPFVTNLPNGIKLIVQPESVSDTVSVYGRVKNNPKVQMPAGQDGVDEALDKLFSYGTKSLDRLAFQKALDDIGANESAGADFSLQVLPDQFDARRATARRQRTFARAARRRFQNHPDRSSPRASPANCKSPDHIAGHALTSALFPQGDPARRADNARQLSNRSRSTT